MYSGVDNFGEAGIAWRADREGKHARRRNKKARYFTHFLTHKSTLLSRRFKQPLDSIFVSFV